MLKGVCTKNETDDDTENIVLDSKPVKKKAKKAPTKAPRKTSSKTIKPKLI